MRKLLCGLALTALATTSCATTPRPQDITGQTWTLVELFGESVNPQDTSRPVTLTLDPARTRTATPAATSSRGRTRSPATS